MTAEERKSAIITATLPLLYQHGRGVTTRLIAEAAGIAEGTIFRVFDSKDELVEATVVSAFDPNPFVLALEGIDPDGSLEDTVLAVVSVMQVRYRSVFGLMRTCGLSAPPDRAIYARYGEEWRARGQKLMHGLFAPHVHELRLSVDDLVHRLRLLTFSASHDEISDGQVLTPAEITDTLLHGVLKKGTS